MAAGGSAAIPPIPGLERVPFLTNATLFDGTDPNSVRGFFDEVMAMGVEGIVISPGYSYDKAPDQNRFLGRARTRRLFRAILSNREKHWKFSPSDIAERAHWDDYQSAYQAAIAATATPHAPWFVVPADHKWYTQLIVVGAMIEALEVLDLKVPELTPQEQAELDVARKKLENEPD